MDTSVSFATKCVYLGKPLIPPGHLRVSHAMNYFDFLLFQFLQLGRHSLTFCILTLPPKYSHFIIIFLIKNEVYGLSFSFLKFIYLRKIGKCVSLWQEGVEGEGETFFFF